MMRDINGLKLNNEDNRSKVVANRNISSKQSPCGTNVASHATNVPPMPLDDCTNKTIPLIPSKLARKWSKLTCAINSENQATPVQMVSDCGPGL